MLFKFLWGSGKENVKRRTTVKDVGDGGLQMTDIECQINALKIKWISRLLDVNNTGVYYNIVKDLFIHPSIAKKGYFGHRFVFEYVQHHCFGIASFVESMVFINILNKCKSVGLFHFGGKNLDF